MIAIITILTLVYTLLIGSFIWGFNRVKSFQFNNLKPVTRFTVIVPFRNEATQLPALLESIFLLDYPKEHYEVILVDDESDDDSRKILEALFDTNADGSGNITVINTLRTTNSPKKDAITVAIAHATTDWIITTDADCILPKYWLNSFDNYIQKHDAALIVAPVTYHEINGFLKTFQLLDVLSLQGVTMGAFGISKPFLCNGANLAYTKQLFYKVNGFEGNHEVASGDDVFLLEKALIKNPSKVHYLKSKYAIVVTSALNILADVIDQRVRWAAKSSAYENTFSKLAGSIVFAQNALLISGLCLTLIGVVNPKLLLSIFLVKISIDFMLIYKSAAFFGQKKHLKQYAIAIFCYPFFSVFVVCLAVFKGFKWKERHYRQ